MQFNPARPENYSPGRTKKIEYIVIHYTGNDNDTARSNCHYFANYATQTSAHYFVDDRETLQSVEDTDTAYHCGATNYLHQWCRNANSIGIEMCSKKDADGNFCISEDTKAGTIALARALMKQYNIPPANVLRHYDVTGKLCPEPFVRELWQWEDFKFRLNNGRDAMQGQSIIIKPEEIIVSGLYRNINRKSMSTIVNESGAKVCINAGFYTLSTFTPCASGLKIDGVKYVDGFDPGYSFDRSSVIFNDKNSIGYPDYIGGYPALIKASKAFKSNVSKEPHWDIANARSAMGLLDNGNIYLFCTGKPGITMDGLRNAMLSAGCKDAINLDGGASSQCYFDGRLIKGERDVYSYILIWRKKDLIKKGHRGRCVQYMQRKLLLRGYQLPIFGSDGDFGNETYAALTAFQKAKGLTVDGVCGPKTWEKLI